ncbi:MAG: hypothetical protein K0R38_3261 [Polyangiaceae bacterium]|jgi:CBS domain-containing protein|nr:hypothetical protein [Polyangiaceae bacterium]
MKVEDIMTRDVRSCAPEESLSSAAQIMWEVDCGAVPVVDAQQRVIGMITDRDICMASHLQGTQLGDASVSTAMARDIKTCSPQDSPATVQALMQQHKIRRVPVVDADRRLIGIVTLADLAYIMGSSQTLGGDGMTWSAVGHTLAAVCEPRGGRYTTRYGNGR